MGANSNTIENTKKYDILVMWYCSLIYKHQ